MDFWKIVIMLAIVFVLTYDTKSGVIEKYVEVPQKPKEKHQHFQSVQFAVPQPAEDLGFKSKMGAIVA